MECGISFGLVSIPGEEPLFLLERKAVMLSTRVATRVNSVLYIGTGVFNVYKIKEEYIMLDIKFLRTNFEEVKAKLQHRGEDLTDFGRFEELDTRRRELLVQTEELKSKRNEVSQQISVLKREKKDAEALILEMREVGEKVKDLDNELRTVEEDLERLMLSIPNIPHESAPVGETEDDNVVARTWGEVKEFTYEPKPHWDLATDLEF